MSETAKDNTDIGLQQCKKHDIRLNPVIRKDQDYSIAEIWDAKTKIDLLK